MASVDGNSIGVPSICDAYDQGIWGAMNWAKTPIRSTDFSVRSGGDAQKEDPTEYKPGELVYIHVRSLKQSAKPRGFMLYAKDSSGNKVGAWELPADSESKFHTPPGACNEQAVMHNSATEKNYHNVFPFRTPAPGTGSITFECLLKLGPANTGYFIWPNAKDLKMAEATVPHRSQWFKGAKGNTCTATCAGVGGSCDAAKLQEASSAPKLDEAIKRDYACKQPLLKTKSCTSPAESTDGSCSYATGCGTKTTCDSRSGRLRRLCPCSGVNQAMVETLDDVDSPVKVNVDEDTWSETIFEQSAEEPKQAMGAAKCESFAASESACENAGCYFEAEEGLNLCTKFKNPLGGSN